MRRFDIAIIVVIVAAVIFSGIGVATYEAGPQDIDFEVTWGTDDNQLPAKTGTRAGNGAVNIDYPIDLDNLTEVTINVRVAGPGPRPTAVTASVDLTPVNATKPAAKSIALAQGLQGGSGETSFVVKVQDLPAVTTASGADENATKAELNNTHRTETGSGVWKVVVTISGSTAAPGVGAEAFTVTVSGQAKTYRPTLEVFSPDINR